MEVRRWFGEAFGAGARSMVRGHYRGSRRVEERGAAGRIERAGGSAERREARLGEPRVHEPLAVGTLGR